MRGGMKVQLLDLEGMAMNGLIKDVKIVDDGKGMAHLVATTVDGKVIETVSDEKGVVAKSYFIILKYIEWGKYIARR